MIRIDSGVSVGLYSGHSVTLAKREKDMISSAFIRKWKAANLKEHSAAQEHFLDLYRLLGEPTLAEVDPEGKWYCFERGASTLTGNNGWADVWKRGHFG
jgi:hypothetical protein